MLILPPHITHTSENDSLIETETKRKNSIYTTQIYANYSSINLQRIIHTYNNNQLDTICNLIKNELRQSIHFIQPISTGRLS